MFIRVKKRKNKDGTTRSYAYLVHSRYYKRRKTPRQKAKKYLGRVVRFKQQDIPTTPITSEQLERWSTERICQQLLHNELLKQGFIWQKQALKQGSVIIDLEEKQVYDEKTHKNVCVAVNEGFVTNYTLRQLLAFKPPEGRERDIGKSLGHAIVAAGLPIDHDVFISLFRKVIASLDDRQQ